MKRQLRHYTTKPGNT